jgi:FAD/FMN-containing dehydrogenase
MSTHLDGLRRVLDGQLLLPGSGDYDQARKVWNGSIDRYPAAIARCTGVADVVAALRHAREQGLPIAVRGGGHNVAGLSTCDDGMVIDLGPMKGVRVDPVARTATAGPGVVWREFDRETQHFGLATPGGTVSDTGIAGLTLGGGLGFLSRRFGLTSDNLLSADLITAEGRLLHVSDDEHPDLMWGLRGGGGNFGIVTSFTYRLHELAGPVLGGVLVYPADEAAERVRLARDWAEQASDGIALMIMLLTAPPVPFLPPELHGRPVVMLQLGWSGPLGDGERELAALRAAAPPVVDTVAPLPYTVLQRATDAIAVPGHRYYLKASFLRALDGAAIDTALRYHERVPSPSSAIGFTVLGGAIARSAPGSTAFAHRHARWMSDIFGIWQSPQDDPGRYVAWVRGLYAELDRVATGGYVNHLDADETDTSRGYTADIHARLVAVKTAYDPDNVFRRNPNIRPARPVGGSPLEPLSAVAGR